jgi:outer membrane protein OmpA-like peptidoglycan-associated protein
MVFAPRLPRVIALVACAALLGYGAVATAQSAFDSAKAGATAQQIADQVKQVRAQLSSADTTFANDLRELEGHADHLRSGLASGLGEEPTSPVVKRVVDLALAANERAKLAGASAATLQSLDAVQAKVVELEGLYGIDVASPAPAMPAPPIAKADPCQEKVRLIGVEFAFDSADLTPESAATLGIAVEKLKACAAIGVAIDGYTDSTGPAKWNQQLSQKRADTVQAFLIKNGIAADRLSARGDGEASPIASNATIAGRAENRRVELGPKS